MLKRSDPHQLIAISLTSVPEPFTKMQKTLVILLVLLWSVLARLGPVCSSFPTPRFSPFDQRRCLDFMRFYLRSQGNDNWCCFGEVETKPRLLAVTISTNLESRTSDTLPNDNPNISDGGMKHDPGIRLSDITASMSLLSCLLLVPDIQARDGFPGFLPHLSRGRSIESNLDYFLQLTML